MKRASLYVVHGSHPCATVQRVLEMKGIPYRTIELPPYAHAAIQRVLFGERTVPAIKLDGEKIVGSRAIVRRLEQLRPDPPLFPADPDERAKVEEAERWGDEVLQPIARRLLWPALKRRPDVASTYTDGGKLPLPAPVVRLTIPLIARGEIALNQASEQTVRDDLAALPGHLDRIDAWIAEGRMGGDPPNAADLQIATTLRLLMSLGDLGPVIEPRPAGRLALALFPEAPGATPAGVLPAQWVPAPAPA